MLFQTESEMYVDARCTKDEILQNVNYKIFKLLQYTKYNF